MLNYVQTPERTTVSVFPLQHQPHTGLSLMTSPLADVPLPSSPVPTPEESCEQGQRAGRAEASALLAQAEQAKGEPLTKSEIMKCYEARCFEQMKQHPFAEATRHFSDGWWQGFVQVCMEARDATPEPVRSIEPEPVAGTVNFRRAAIDTDDVEEFTKGIECGQTCFVEDGLPITTQSLFTLFAGAVDADDPEAYNIGFILGYADALCRNSKRVSCGFLRGPQPAKKVRKRTKQATRKR